MLSATGKHWTEAVEIDLNNKIVENLQSIANTKAFYAEVYISLDEVIQTLFDYFFSFQTYFQQMALELLTGARFFADITQNTTLRPNWYTDGSGDLSLPSYSCDAFNPHHSVVAGTTNYTCHYGPVSYRLLSMAIS